MLKGSYCHITSSLSRIGVVFKTTSVPKNSFQAFARACTVGLATMASGVLETLLQTRSLDYSTTDLKCHELELSDNSGFSLQHHHGRISVWPHRRERKMPTRIRHSHTGLSPGKIIWNVIECTHRSPLDAIDWTEDKSIFLKFFLKYKNIVSYIFV